MLFHIARREFVSNILTARFAVGFILCLFLFLSSTYVLTSDYEGRLKKYSESVIEHQKGLEKVKVYSQLKVTVDRQPEKLSIFCEGFDKQLGTTVTIAYDEVPAVATGYTVEAGENIFVLWAFLPSILNISTLLTIFPSFDIALIVQVVLSILALLFAYDTISGEKERGTLALTLSNPVPRSTLLFGKYIGGMLSIVLPFSTTFLIVLMVVLLSPAVQMYASDWVSLLLIFLCSLIYISLFFTLGMFISSRTSRSATSLIILLFLWVALVMLLPNASAYIAKRIRPVGTMESIDSQKDALNKEMGQKMEDYASKHPMPEKCYITDRGLVHRGDWPFVYDYIHNGSRNMMQWYLEGTVKFWVPLRMEYARKRWELYRQYYDNLEKQATFAKDISRLSPAWTFYNVTSIFAGTDIGSHRLFMERTRRYRSELIDYLQSKKALSSMAWFTRVKENELLTDEDIKTGVEMMSAMMDGRMKEFRKIDGKGDPRWDWEAIKPLDLNDMPKFPLGREELSNSFKRALLDLVILVILNVALFMGTYASFIRADVK